MRVSRCSLLRLAAAQRCRAVGRPVYDRRMFAAPVWHYWIGVAIALPSILVMVVLFAQYLRKTQAPKYGRDD